MEFEELVPPPIPGSTCALPRDFSFLDCDVFEMPVVADAAWWWLLIMEEVMQMAAT